MKNSNICDFDAISLWLQIKTKMNCFCDFFPLLLLITSELNNESSKETYLMWKIDEPNSQSIIGNKYLNHFTWQKDKIFTVDKQKRFTSHYKHIRKITLRQLVTLFNVTHSAMVGHGLCAGVPEFMGSVSFKLLRNCWPWLASSAQLRKALA